ncbi:hypothetical protein MOP88_17620 [Sphingomonas sp. WKB10]|nr:hypothetical protein [Sphingomonas sp. WKB10]
MTSSAASARQLQAMRWGFPHPHGVRNPVVNVRNYSSPFWRSALANPERRYLVPATSFQEWSVDPDPMTGKKKPHWFSVPSRPILLSRGVATDRRWYCVCLPHHRLRRRSLNAFGRGDPPEGPARHPAR